MVEAARRKNVRFGVAHVFRFDESVGNFESTLQPDAIGRPIFARSEFSFLADPSHPRKWLYDASVAGAGPVFDIGVHCIDTLRFILQDEVVRVSATANSDKRSGDVESSAAMTLEFSRGNIGDGIGFVSRRISHAAGNCWAMRAFYGRTMRLNVEHPIQIELRRGQDIVQREKVSNHLAYALQVDAFADWIEGKSQFPASGGEGWQNQEILDAALRSIKSGKARGGAASFKPEAITTKPRRFTKESRHRFHQAMPFQRTFINFFRFPSCNFVSFVVVGFRTLTRCLKLFLRQILRQIYFPIQLDLF